MTEPFKSISVALHFIDPTN